MMRMLYTDDHFCRSSDEQALCENCCDSFVAVGRVAEVCESELRIRIVHCIAGSEGINIGVYVHPLWPNCELLAQCGIQYY